MEQDIRLAYLCFIDVVGYSRHFSSEQLIIVEKIESVFQKTISTMDLKESDYLSIATGDGMAVCFWSRPEHAIVFALEFSRLLSLDNARLLPEHRFGVRIGVHFGLVLPATDISGHRNVVGSGINICARVMSLGQAGHILTSDIVYRLLAEHQNFAPMFQALGPFAVKHGIVLNIYNVLGQWRGIEVGNVNRPAQLSTPMLKSGHIY